MPSTRTGAAERNHGRPRVLTVLPDFPFPATTGLHLRHLSNLELVHRLGCYSALLYFTTEERDGTPLESALANICDQVRHGGRRFPHAGFSTASLVAPKLDFLMRGALGVAGNRYPFSMSYDRIGAEQIVVDEARRVAAEYVILPSFMLHYAAALAERGYRVIADAIDVLTELTQSFRSYASNPARRFTLYANHLASRTQERVFLRRCCEVWATSNSEAETLARIAPGVNVVTVSNSLDQDVFRPSSFLQEKSVGFIGTYSSRPNLDAALFLAEQVFPEVLRRHPDARLKLAGASLPGAEEIRLRKQPFVDLLGAIEDSADLYNQCRVIALPVFVRGGVPLKLIEAMARQKPVVACPELVAGLPVRDGHDVLVRGGGKFANGVCLLLADDRLCRRLAVNARNTFLANWSRSHAESTLRQLSVLTGNMREAVHG